jgi:chloroplastic oxoene reductase
VLARAGDKVVDITVNASVVLTSVVHRVTFARKRLVLVLLWPNKADLEFLVRLVAEGKLWTVLDSRFPLCRVSEAWGKSARGHATGKVVVEMEG